MRLCCGGIRIFEVAVGVFILGDMGLEYGNEKTGMHTFDVVLAFLVGVFVVLKFVGEYASDV